ncbi:MAG TPA: cyclic nucleotide-binding domain-containing protein [Gallionella sp.]|nr:cyclic nucleotide-binding domain-containing protein [Gallionella sp.]
MIPSKQKSSLEGLEPLGAGKLSASQVASMLDDVQMFRDFEWTQIEALSAYLQLYQASPGAVLFREGDHGDFMCIVLKGKLEIHKEDHLGVDKTVATVLPGRSLGEMTMVDGEARSATAIAVSDATLAVLTQENFQNIVRDKPALAVKMLLKVAQLLSQRLRHTSGILVDFLEK